jgi:phosphoribosylanthranilate isomerase
MKIIHDINTTSLQTKTLVPVPCSLFPIKIKICGLFREQDIDYVNEAKPDYIGFVFAESKRKVSPAFAAQLRRRLSGEIIPVGVFVNAPIADIVALYNDNVISIAQLHGDENDEYITRLKAASDSKGNKPIEVIKTMQINEKPDAATAHSSLLPTPHSLLPSFSTDYYLIDSGAGSGETFDWELLNSPKVEAIKAKPWFLAGGLGLGNIERALGYAPYALDVSSGAETDGIKDREKILQLVSIIRGTQRKQS